MNLQRLVIPPLYSALAFLLLSPGVASAGGKYKVLHGFTGKPDGGGVFAGVAFDSQGNLYGTTWGGGAYGYGTVFALSPHPGGKWRETILHSFCPDFPHCQDGAGSESTPVFDTSGNFYGTSNDDSFEMSPSGSGWNFSLIYGNAGSSSYTIDASGSLYGANGVVWELSPGSSGWGLNILYTFCQQHECRDGWDALAPPVFDAAGNLYGTTEFGGNLPPKCPGSAGCGVAYELHPLGGGLWKYRVIHRFAAFKKDGQLPQSGLTVDGAGNLYGTTLYNGVTSGTVFELSPQANGNWKETILYSFPNPLKYGGAPVGGVTFDQHGNLYGTASAGGDPTCSCGVIFKMTPQSNGKWKYTVLHRFTGADGYGPGADLVFDKSYKHLYGTTVAGGSGGAGVVYEYTP